MSQRPIPSGKPLRNCSRSIGCRCPRCGARRSTPRIPLKVCSQRCGNANATSNGIGAVPWRNAGWPPCVSIVSTGFEPSKAFERSRRSSAISKRSRRLSKKKRHSLTMTTMSHNVVSTNNLTSSLNISPRAVFVVSTSSVVAARIKSCSAGTVAFKGCRIGSGIFSDGFTSRRNDHLQTTP